MTKNERDIPSFVKANEGLRVKVLDEDGNLLGLTYEKRAKGLVKKQRAEYITDGECAYNAIRMKIVPSAVFCPDKEKDKTIMKKIYFNPREWHFDYSIQSNSGSTMMITGIDGNLTEIFTIGGWNYAKTVIMTEPIATGKNQNCVFTFWLNGGEDDRISEICNLEIVYPNVSESYTYKLSRGLIKPVLHCKGWELFEIKFNSGENESVILKFVSENAPMSIMTAADISKYSEYPDEPDVYAEYRPQRHNIVFRDGWPDNKSYSTMNIKNQLENKSNTESAKSINEKFITDLIDRIVNEIAENTDDINDDNIIREAVEDTIKSFFGCE